ncbi:hypothetical protein LILAB_36710 [Corallococcus macrosporus]|uniref:Uncharacterized protein n=1 Tax=Myxococcus fulvus (strain ATCC BAA-855 / HW-1) TaxID=483219 RepID=F8CQX4_MYXFH|nr:hypothetical protein LILAB_36710 [Corallococcus macrosporus]
MKPVSAPTQGPRYFSPTGPTAMRAPLRAQAA